MIEANTVGWRSVGETSNTRYFVPGPGLLVGVPRRGSLDDEASATANVSFQVTHFRDRGEPGVVVIFFDYLVSQDVGARKVYQKQPDPDHMLATALVGGTLLSRAMGAFFLGLAKPRIPLKMFASAEEAFAWGRQIAGMRQAMEG